MNVMLFSTKCCSYSKKLSRELDELGVKYYLVHCDDEPELVVNYSIQKSSDFTPSFVKPCHTRPVL